MPLHVDIRINERLLHTINIGRLHGGTKPDDINTYRAVTTLGGRDFDVDYYAAGSVEFAHRYGDGADICIAKAIAALTAAATPDMQEASTAATPPTAAPAPPATLLDYAIPHDDIAAYYRQLAADDPRQADHWEAEARRVERG
jgi:hypothetical protein